MLVQSFMTLNGQLHRERPSFNYLETYLPVVHIESIHIILAIAVMKQLMIQQINVKGAYLNGTLCGTIYTVCVSPKASKMALEEYVI